MTLCRCRSSVRLFKLFTIEKKYAEKCSETSQLNKSLVSISGKRKFKFTVLKT